MARTWHNWQVDGAALIGLALAGRQLTRALPATLDLRLLDESFYLGSGLHVVQTGWPSADFGPLFAAWYAALSRVQPDAVPLFYLSAALLTGLLPPALYAVARRLGAGPWPALGAAFWLLISFANLPTFPKPMHLATLLLLLTLGAASLTGDRARQALLLGGGSALAAYARPDLLPAAALWLAYAAWRLAQRRPTRRDVVVVAALAGGLLVPAAAWGVPAGGGSSRSFIAFSQHFALNWENWTGDDVAPWTHADIIVTDAFGDVGSVAEAARRRPALFLRHLATNAVRAPRVALATALRHLPLWPQPTAAQLAPAAWGALALWLALVGAGWRRGDSAWQRLGRRPVLRAALPLTALVVVPAAVVIYPREHYLVLPVVMGLLWTALWGTGSAESRPRLTRFLPALLLMVLITPGAGALRLLDGGQQPVLRTVHALRDVGLTAPVRLFDGTIGFGGYDVYLGDNYRPRPVARPESDFATFQAEQGINLLVLDGALAENGRLRADPTWQAFVGDYAAAGFVAQRVPGTDNWLLIDRRLLPDGAP